MEALLDSYRPKLYSVVPGGQASSPLEPRQICELCCISSPSLVGVLTRMEQERWIVRESVPHDQRRVLVKLTSRARAWASGMVPEIEAAYACIEARVGKTFVRQLQNTLENLLEELEPASGGLAQHSSGIRRC